MKRPMRAALASFLSLCALATAALLAVAVPAIADERSSYTLKASPEVTALLLPAMKAPESGDYAAARASLDAILSNPTLTEVERLIVLDLRATALYRLGDYSGALADIEAMLASPALEPTARDFLERWARMIESGRDALSQCDASAPRCENSA